MTAPPAVVRDTSRTGIATVIASQDEAELIAAYRAQGRRLSPGRARMLVAAHLAEADRRADRYADPDLDMRILGIHADPTPRDAIRRIEGRAA